MLQCGFQTTYELSHYPFPLFHFQRYLPRGTYYSSFHLLGKISLAPPVTELRAHTMQLPSSSYVHFSRRQHSTLADYSTSGEGCPSYDLDVLNGYDSSIMFPFGTEHTSANSPYSQDTIFQPDQQTHAASGALFGMRHSHLASSLLQPKSGHQHDQDSSRGPFRLFGDSFHPRQSDGHTACYYSTQWSSPSHRCEGHTWAGVSGIEVQTSSPFVLNSNNHRSSLPISGYDSEYLAEMSPACHSTGDISPAYQTGPPDNRVHTLVYNEDRAFDNSSPSLPWLTPISRSSDVKVEFEGCYDSGSLTNKEASVEDKLGDIPYAKLIYAALMDAPDHRMILRDIYRWIEHNTDKASDPSFTGWQNSVRHNLSMNQVSIRDSMQNNAAAKCI